jgi:hypothetical protein
MTRAWRVLAANRTDVVLAVGIGRRTRPALLRLQADVANDLPPDLVFVFDEFSRRCGSFRAICEEAKFHQAISHPGFSQDLVHVLIDPPDNVRRRSCRRHQHKPANQFDSRQSFSQDRRRRRELPIAGERRSCRASLSPSNRGRDCFTRYGSRRLVPRARWGSVGPRNASSAPPLMPLSKRCRIVLADG